MLSATCVISIWMELAVVVNVARRHIAGLRDWNGYALLVPQMESLIVIQIKWQHILQYKCTGEYAVADGRTVGEFLETT